MSLGEPRRRYAGNLPRFLLFQALVYCYLWMPIWVVFLQARGMSLSRIGTLDSVGWVIMAVAEVPTGAVADRFGRKVSLAMGALLYSLGMFAFAAKVMSPVFVIGYLLWATSNTLFSGADMAFLYDSLAAEGRQGEFAKHAGRTNAVVQGAQALGSLVGAVLASYNMLLCFIVAGGLSLAAVAVALSLHEPPAHDAPSGDRRPTFFQTIGSALRVVVERPVARYLLIFRALVSVFSFLLSYNLFQPYATAVRLPVALLGTVVLLSRGAAILGSSIAHVVSRKLGAVLIVGWPLSLVLCQLMLGALPSLPSISLFFVVALISATARPTLAAALNQEIPSSQRATVLSLESLLWSLLLAVIEPTIMALGDRIGIPRAIGVAGLLLMLLVIPVGMLWRRTARLGQGRSLGAPV